MDTSQSLEKKIIDIVGKDFVFIDKQDMVVYERDGTHDKGMPDFVVLPRTTEEVAKLVLLANEFELPIIEDNAHSFGLQKIISDNYCL